MNRSGLIVGIAAVFTPKDYDLTKVMDRVLDIIRQSTRLQHT